MTLVFRRSGGTAGTCCSPLHSRASVPSIEPRSVARVGLIRGLDSHTVSGCIVSDVGMGRWTFGGSGSMLKIGELAKLGDVSVRMLRHYDDLDLLKPIIVDRFTGY